MTQAPFSRRDLLAGLSAVSAGLALKAPFAAAAAAAAAAAPEAKEGQALTAYFHGHARELLRPAMGVLRFPSISPSLPRAEYSSDLWDWDTLWTVRGLFRLAALTQDKELHAEIAAHAQGALANFFDHQAPDGRIPMLITVKDADPLGCLRGTAPHKENQAKPVLAQLALMVSEELGDAKWFAPHLPKLRAFHASWRENNLVPAGLLVWGDDVAIGNDNDPTTFGRPFFSSANLLLNCLYYQDLRAAAVLAERLGDSAESTRASAQAKQLADAIQQHCWDPRDRFFYTADVQCRDRRAELIPNIARGMSMSWSTLPLRVQSFTGFLPMGCGIATRAQCDALVAHLANGSTMGARYGVRTLSAAETMYSLVPSSNPSNWLGPIWIVSNYLVWKGLAANGYTAQAAQMAAATVSLLARDLAHSGSLNEYYHPDTGAPLSHAGFMDWNLLALEMI